MKKVRRRRKRHHRSKPDILKYTAGIFIIVICTCAVCPVFLHTDESEGYKKAVKSGCFGWPAPELNAVTSTFTEKRSHPLLKSARPHWGVDISGDKAQGSPVAAVSSGLVILAEIEDKERGCNILVEHLIGADRWLFRYQHLSEIKVKAGQTVKKGDVIGTVGNTGLSTGAHLHLEVSYNGTLVDPLPLIQRAQ